MEKSEFRLEFEKPLRELDKQLQALRALSEESKMNVDDEVAAIEKKIEQTKRSIYSSLTIWQKVLLARHPKRPTSLDYIGALFDDFQEIHGDRLFRDDPAFVGGPAFFDGAPVMILGQQKGRDTKGNLRRNFGCPHPEGYRKVLRLVRLAEKFNLPVISFIDTPGAFPGIGAEERHVAEAIAVNIREMSALKVPIVAIVIGEGGSGGALGAAMADVVLVLENAYYSVISPEGCAAILWKDRSHAATAAEALALNSRKLVEFGIADAVVEEPLGGAHRDPGACAKSVGTLLRKYLSELSALSTGDRLERRYQKYRHIGDFAEKPPAPEEKEAAV